MIEICFTK